jgi:glycosyltransferase involved in cell wall biosynthesis
MGSAKKEIARAIGKTKNIITTGYVQDEELPALYGHAITFVLPSWYEGFGMPVIEAFSHGIPVITSNNSSLKEIARGAALLVNPGDYPEIARAISSIISNKKLRDDFITRGLKQAKKFSWAKTARETLRVFKEVAHA